jgi:carboxypeptidase PM20D1
VDDDRIAIKVSGRFSAEPSRVSRIDSDEFRTLERTIRSTVANAVVAPYLVVVATDARHYADLGDSIFRFLPLRLSSDDLDRMHGIDERVGIRDNEGAINPSFHFSCVSIRSNSPRIAPVSSESAS